GVITSADEPSRPTFSSQRIGESQHIAGFGQHVRGGDRLWNHHVVVDQEREVLADWLPVNDTPRLHRGLSGIRPPTDDNPIVLAPLRALLLGVVPEDVREPLLQLSVALELELDLAKETLGDTSGVGEDANAHLSTSQGTCTVRSQDVLDGLGVGDDRRLVVLPAPQVEVSVGLSLDFSA